MIIIAFNHHSHFFFLIKYLQYSPNILQSDFTRLTTMSYNQTLNFWFSCLKYIGMSSAKSQKSVGFFVLMSAGLFILGFAIADLFYNSKVKYTLETLVMLANVFCINVKLVVLYLVYCRC